MFTDHKRLNPPILCCYLPYKAMDAVANSKTFKSARELLDRLFTGSAHGESLPYRLFVPERNRSTGPILRTCSCP